MATGVSNSLAQAINNAIFNGASFSFPDGAYLAIMSTASTATAFGTEFTGGSYARALIGGGTPSGNTIANDATGVFANLPAGTIAGYSIVDKASGAPTMWEFIDGLSISVAAGENKTINVGDLTNPIN